MEVFEPVLMSFLATILTLALSLGVAYATAYVQKASKALQDKTESELLDNTIDRVERLALKAVSALEQEAGNMIRLAVKEGRITKEAGREELKALAPEAYSRIVKELGSKGLLLLAEQKVDIEVLVHDSIEEALLKLKNPLSVG